VLREALLVGIAGIFFLEPPGIRKKDLTQAYSRWAGVNRSLESIFDEAGQIAGVIDMSMSQNDRVEAPDVSRYGAAIP